MKEDQLKELVELVSQLNRLIEKMLMYQQGQNELIQHRLDTITLKK